MFPATGKLTGKLVAAVGEAEALEAALDRCGTVCYGIDAGDEIEILAFLMSASSSPTIWYETV